MSIRAIMIQINFGGKIMFRAVLFDMDGVIIDSEPLHMKAFQIAMKDYGLDLTDDYCYQFIGRTDRYMVEVLVMEFNLIDSVDNILQHKKDTLVELETNIGYPSVPYVKQLIQNLHAYNIKLAIASSSPMTAIRETARTQGLTAYFTEYVSGTELLHSKPAPDIFLKAAHMLAVKPSECVVIEDSEHGVAAAKAAGMTCVGYQNLNSGNQDLSKADIIIEGFEEIDYDFLLAVYQRSHKEPVTIGTTTHCILRELSIDDFPNLYRIANLSMVNKYLCDSLDTLEIELEKHKAYIENVYSFFGYGYWGIFDIETNALIGRCGIQNKEVDNRWEVELGYLLDPSYQGKGYALECAQYALDYAFEYLKIPRVIAVIHTENEKSKIIAKKLGMQKEKDILYLGFPCELYTKSDTNQLC
jgi:beta-phosphoglucomutase family hydrolase